MARTLQLKWNLIIENEKEGSVSALFPLNRFSSTEACMQENTWKRHGHPAARVSSTIGSLSPCLALHQPWLHCTKLLHVAQNFQSTQRLILPCSASCKSLRQCRPSLFAAQYTAPILHLVDDATFPSGVLMQMQHVTHRFLDSS
jgi:hypothetical protein